MAGGIVVVSLGSGLRPHIHAVPVCLEVRIIQRLYLACASAADGVAQSAFLVVERLALGGECTVDREGKFRRLCLAHVGLDTLKTGFGIGLFPVPVYPLYWRSVSDCRS